MLVGDVNRFAIEADPETVDGSWILGRFRFWIGGCAVGDWDDCAALQYCFDGLRAFSQSVLDRVEPIVAHSTPEEVFALIVAPVLGTPGVADPRRQPIPFSYERFHITQLGASSFDNLVVVLVKDAVGAERCLWMNHDEREIRAFWLAAGEMERVAAMFCELFETSFGPIPG